MRDLKNIKVAVLATDGFEQSELLEPVQALKEAGARVDIVAPHEGSIRGWKHKEWGDSVQVDETLEDVDPMVYDALMLPGGVMSPDQLRMNERAVEFVKTFTDSGRPIAAICHGPQTLIEAGFLKGRTLTSWPSLRTDILNAGGKWVDEEVVVDKGLVTSRKPDDIPAFNKRMIEEFAEAVHRRVTQTQALQDNPLTAPMH